MEILSDFWNKKYTEGHQQKYPWDIVVSFLLGTLKRCGGKAEDTHVLEVGFGTGANLWFAAREGFQVSGIEMSPAAVNVAIKRLEGEGLEGNLLQGDFANLPFDEGSFDIIIDRAALTCVPKADILHAVREIARVAKPQAQFLFNCYADSHSSARSGEPAGGCVRQNITDGTLEGLDQIAFLSANDVLDLFEDDWLIQSMSRMETTEMKSSDMQIHAEWRVIAERC